MYDFIKVTGKANNSEKAINYIGLDFELKVNNFTGEISYYVGEDKKLKFLIYPNGRVNILGSFHKYFNDGLHNYNDYSIIDFKETLSVFTSLYKINPDKLYLKNLEIGVNLILNFDPDIIINNLINHKGEEFYKKNIKGGAYSQAEHSHYYLKAYNKGKHFSTRERIFRFEIKYVRMQFLNRNGINVLSDLTINKNILFLQNELIKAWSEIFMIEPFIKYENFPNCLKDKFGSYINPNFWKSLYIASKRAKNKKFYTELNKYKGVINNNNELSLKRKVHSMIIEKLKTLNNYNDTD